MISRLTKNAGSETVVAYYANRGQSQSSRVTSRIVRVGEYKVSEAVRPCNGLRIYWILLAFTTVKTT